MSGDPVRIGAYEVGIPCSLPSCKNLLSAPIMSVEGQCNHVFHRACIAMSTTAPKCPNCHLVYAGIYRDEEYEKVTASVDILGRAFLGEHSDEPITNKIFKKAVKEGIIHVVEFMLKNKMATPSLLINGLSPLFIACKNGNRELARLLLAHGANPSQRNDLSCRGRPAHDYDREQHATPIQAAAKRGHLDLVVLLVSKGASIDERDEENRTPLFTVVSAGKEDMALSLIAEGASIHVQDRNGFTLISMAVRRKLSKVVEALVKRGVSVTSVDKEKQTCIHLAADKDKPEMLALLLRYGGREVVNHKWLDYYTPLYLAADTGLLRNVLLLVEAGADLSMTYTGDSILTIAEKSLKSSIADIESTDSQHRHLVDRVVREKEAVVKYLSQQMKVVSKL